MTTSNPSPNGSQVSDITYGSLQTVASPSSTSSHPLTTCNADITWGSLASAHITTQESPNSRLLQELSIRSPPSIPEAGAPPGAGPNLNVHRQSPSSPVPIQSPLRHSSEQQTCTMPLSQAAGETSRKRPSPFLASVTTPKRARSKVLSDTGHSDDVLPNKATQATPSPNILGSTAHPNSQEGPSPSWQPSLPTTPIHSIMNSPGSNYSGASSSSSTRRARAPPGSPVWQHLQNLKLARLQGSQQNPQLRTPKPSSPLKVQVDATPSRSVSSLSSLVSHNVSTELQQANQTPTQQSKPCRAPPPHPTRDIHLSQLSDMVRHTANLCNNWGKRTVDQMLLDPDYQLYLQVYVACLMHAIHQPVDPNRTIWLLLDRAHDPSLWCPQLNNDQPPPTHVLGLTQMHLPDEDHELTLLIWGTCEQVDASKLEITLTFYDSEAQLWSVDLMRPYAKAVRELVRASIPDEYEIVLKNVYAAEWPEHYLKMSGMELSMLFCQMISAVVYDIPFDRHTLKQGPPVQPLWAYDLVQAQIRTLLGQVVGGQLRFQDLINGEGIIPESIRLHGDPFESEDFGVTDDASEQHEEQGIPLDNLLDRTNAWVNHRAALELMEPADYYLRVSDDVRYQSATPSNLSQAPTLPTRSHSSPTGTPASAVNDANNEQQRLVELTHTHLLGCPGYAHTARLVYWQQLRESTPGKECISLLTTHLWLSSLHVQPTRNVFYIDPLLAEDLVHHYTKDPLGLLGQDLPSLAERQKLWPQMGQSVNILALVHLPGLCEPNPGALSWVLMDMRVEHGRVTSMDVILAPCTKYDKKEFASLTSSLIGALNSVLPQHSVAAHSSKVQQRTQALMLPQPFTEESIVLVMLAYLLGKMLDQPINSVNIQAMRQGVCFYYDHALRNADIDPSFPWPGLTDIDGKLSTEENSEDVRRKRFLLASNREPSPFEMFPRRRSYAATMATPGPSEPFFLELAQRHSSHPEGILMGTSGRSVTELEKAALLGPYPSFPDKFRDSLLEGPRSLSLDEFVALIESLGGTSSKDAHMVLLTGKHQGRRITIDWLKDATFPQSEWLFAGFDLDSLSLTSYEAPEFREAGAYNPYPNRGMSLTNRNELVVNINGKAIEMHTCPNFCIMTFGANNQFRLLVFLPNCRNRVRLLWRNIPREQEMEDWYRVFVTALRIIRTQVPADWEHAVERTIEALPTTYQMASNQTNHGGGTRSFLGHRIEPVILNHVFKVMRQIINTTPELAKYRDYFFHLCGINLKLATMNIPGREDADPIKYGLTIYNFIDWFAQNPNDIIADVGLAVNPSRASMPVELRRSTLLFRYAPLRELLRPGYQKPQQDRFCLSDVTGGGRAVPRAVVRKNSGVLKVQAYEKMMVLHYRHRDKSIGANFTVAQALGMGHQKKFHSEVTAFQDIMAEADTYGLRFEIRLATWGANRLMKMEPRDILDRFVDSKAIICHPTQTIARFKIMLSKGWSSIIQRQRQLPGVTIRTPEVVLLTSVLAYWLKSLVKRPDEMSATREMVENLYLMDTAERHGLQFLRSWTLDQDGLRVSYVVNAENFKILEHSNVIVPGGNRIKSSKANRVIAPEPNALQSPPPSPPRVQEPPIPLWSQADDDFLGSLVNVYLPQALWGHFPRDCLRLDTQATALRKMPLKLASWPKVVDHLNTTKEIRGKFMESINHLFPPNWTSDATEGHFVSFNRDFLQRIRDRIATRPREVQSSYSQELRQRIRRLMVEKWDYVPCAQAHKIWPYDSGPGGQRQFRIARKNT